MSAVRTHSWIVLLASMLAWAAAVAAQDPLGPGPDRYYAYQLNHISMTDAADTLTILGYKVLDAGNKIGKPGADDTTRPIVVKLPDSDNVSIAGSFTLDGKNKLTGPPDGARLQRLLIVWDEADPSSLTTLLRLLYEQIDKPARQIRIEAVILEIDRDRFKDLGVDFSGSKDGQNFDFGAGATTPFTYTFERPSTKSPLDLTVSITALVQDGSANVLSQPSVLVLDGRQARIQVGDEIPYTQILSSDLETNSTVVSSTSWAKTGISLNLRPRATEDGSEVTMQVETFVSEGMGTMALTNAVLGPPISSREVQTIVRVNNNTPFIIGGLISQLDSDQRSGIPYLSKIPGLGKLFRKRNRARTSKEVIVLITPRVIPLDDAAFKFSVADDTDLLDQFGLELFRNVYRIESDDVYDLGFITDSESYRQLRQISEGFAASYRSKAIAGGWPPVPPGDKAALARQMRLAVAEQPDFLVKIMEETPQFEGLDLEPLIQLFEGRIPGEDVLVRRMLLGIVDKLDYGRYVQPERIHYFATDGAGGAGEALQLELQPLLFELEGLDKECNTVSLTFDHQSGGDRTFDPPVAVALDAGRLHTDDDFVGELRQRNRRDASGAWERQGVLINECFERGERTSLDLLRSALVLKRVLDVNPSLSLTLDGFHVGRGVVFPDEKSLKQANHIVDRRAATLFYELLDYYPAFEREFDLAFEGIQALVDRDAGEAGE